MAKPTKLDTANRIEELRLQLRDAQRATQDALQELEKIVVAEDRRRRLAFKKAVSQAPFNGAGADFDVNVFESYGLTREVSFTARIIHDGFMLAEQFLPRVLVLFAEAKRTRQVPRLRTVRPSAMTRGRYSAS